MKAFKVVDQTRAILASSSVVTTLLVVDDDPIQRRVIARIGVQAGHRTLTAASLLEATQILTTERVDCLTIDVGLGKDCGLDLLQLVAAHGRKMEVLVISGVSGALLEATRNFALAKGVELFDLFPKPLDLARLRASLAQTRQTCWIRQQADA